MSVPLLPEGQDVVLHLGALIAIPYSYEAPRSCVRANIEGTLNVLQAGRRNAIGRIVHTSTSEVYGTALRVPIHAEHPLQGQSPLLAVEDRGRQIGREFLSIVRSPGTVRPFNTHGPRQSARPFIPTIISQAVERDEIRLGSLTPERDMTYVSDTVAEFIAAGLQTGIEGMTINLATGHLLGWLVRGADPTLMGVDKPIVPDAERMRPDQSEVLKLVSDNRVARRVLGWEPRMDIDDGLYR